MGTNWALAREAATCPEKKADLARAAVILGLIQSGVFMVLGYLLVPQVLSGDKQHLEGLTRLYLFFLPLNFISQNLIALEQGQLRWGRYNLLRLSVILPYLILLMWFLAGPDTPGWRILSPPYCSATSLQWFVVCGSNVRKY